MAITNFRDIGGMRAADGRVVRRGCFYRGAAVTFGSEAERAEFAGLGMRVILDLRSAQEREQTPDEAVPGCAYLPISAFDEAGMAGGNFDLAQMMRTGDLSGLNAYVAQGYRTLPFGSPAYQKLFELMRCGETPLMFHCSAGKDRTGVAAYLILKTLGVPEEAIMADYPYSNVSRREENERVLARFPQAAQAESLLYVQAAYLQSTMDAVAARYGDFSRYLEAEFSLTPADVSALRDRYLEDA